MRRVQRYRQDNDDDDDQQTYQRGRQQDDDDDEDEGYQRGQPRQQQQVDDDDDDNDNANARGSRHQQADDDEDDYSNNAAQRGQQDDEDEDDQRIQRRYLQDDDENNQRRNTSQQQGDDNDDYDDYDDDNAGNTQKELRRGVHQESDDEGNEAQNQTQDDEDETVPSPPPDDDDEDDSGQKVSKSSNVNINLNINLNDLENSDLHEGGVMFSKKLLAQMFSGPGDHDPDEEEVPVHQVQHEHVEAADSGEWTIVELKTQDATGATIYLKAKLDSGADDNFMSFDIYKVTGLDFTPYEGPEGPPSFTMGGGQESQPLGTVRLEYTAGVKPQKFIETFQVLDGLPHDVIIGKPLMTSAHMMMVNPNFANPPEHKGLCIMALPPKDKDSKAKAIAFQKQRAAELQAAYEAKIKAQEAAAPKSEKKKLFGRFGKH